MYLDDQRAIMVCVLLLQRTLARAGPTPMGRCSCWLYRWLQVALKGGEKQPLLSHIALLVIPPVDRLLESNPELVNAACDERGGARPWQAQSPW